MIFLIAASSAESCPGIFSVDQNLIQDEIRKALVFTHKDAVEKLKGINGYLFISWKYFEGNMYKAYSQVLNILGKDQFKQLEWRIFRGTVLEYHKLRSALIDQNKPGNTLNPYYIGMTGMMICAEKYTAGDIHTVYTRAYAALEPAEFVKLGWKDFLGNAHEMYELRAKIIKRGEINMVWDQYVGQEGLTLFANQHFYGDVLVAFMRVSAVLHSVEFNQLNWLEPSSDGQLQRKVTPSSRVFFHSSALVLKGYKGQMGYMRMADKFFDGDMRKAYQRMYAIFGFHRMQQMNWKKFNGHTWEFYALRQKIIDTKGQLLVKYFKDKGYFAFARDHYDGDMKSAFEDIISVLNKAEENLLQWRLFHGSIWDFRRVRLQSYHRKNS